MLFEYSVTSIWLTTTGPHKAHELRLLFTYFKYYDAWRVVFGEAPFRPYARKSHRLDGDDDDDEVGDGCMDIM